MELEKTVVKKRLALFVALTFIISWVIFLLITSARTDLWKRCVYSYYYGSYVCTGLVQHIDKTYNQRGFWQYVSAPASQRKYKKTICLFISAPQPYCF